MSDTYKGAIDCDIHPRVPTPRAVSQYMDEHWRDTVEVRGIETWDSIAYPPNAPLTARQDWRKAGADTEPAKAAKETLDRFCDEWNRGSDTSARFEIEYLIAVGTRA